MDPVNLEYYQHESPGRTDYWKKMAAPRARMSVFLDFLERLPREHIVDLGCGNGELLAEFRARHPDIAPYGIDSSSAQIEANRKNAPEIQWRTYDLDQTTGFPTELESRFDVVVASEIIEHVRNPEALLKNALRFARAGTGTLLLSTQSGVLWETEKRVGHLRHFSSSEMTALLETGGWIPVRVWNAGFPFHDWSKWAANRDPEAVMRAFGGEKYGAIQRLVCLALRFAFLLNSSRKGAQLFAVARRP